MTTEVHRPDDEGASGSTVRSVTRALALLRAIGEGTRLTGQLQRAVGIPGPTAVRLLRTLEQEGFVTRTPDGFAIGPEVTRLFLAVEPDSRTWQTIRSAVDELKRETGETAQFMIESSGMREVVYAAESDHGVRRVMRAGNRYSLHLGASGKLFTSFNRSHEFFASLADQDGMYMTRSGRLRPVKKLEEEAEQARREGVTHAIGPESWAVAAPVARHGSLLGTLSLGIPGSRYSDEFLAKCRTLCRDIASRTSETLERIATDLEPKP